MFRGVCVSWFCNLFVYINLNEMEFLFGIVSWGRIVYIGLFFLLIFFFLETIVGECVYLLDFVRFECVFCCVCQVNCTVFFMIMFFIWFPSCVCFHCCSHTVLLTNFLYFICICITLYLVCIFFIIYFSFFFFYYIYIVKMEAFKIY